MPIGANFTGSIVNAQSVTWRDESGRLGEETVRGNGLLVLRIGKADRRKLAAMVKKAAKGEAITAVKWDATLAVAQPRRTLRMNRLYWSLMTIWSMEAMGSTGYEESLHEAVLDAVAERVVARDGKTYPKRSKDMSVAEFSRCIEYVFAEINSLGAEIADPQEIDRYWREFYAWRGTQPEDPLECIARSDDEYRRAVNRCEACRKYLSPDADGYDGHIAHIVARGAGGSDDNWNKLHLCAGCHVGEGSQHQQGWARLVGRFEHLRWRIERAFEKSGATVPWQKAANLEDRRSEEPGLVEDLDIF